MHAATFFEGEGWRDGIIDRDGERMRLRAEPPARDLPRLDGVVIGGFTDHHVHLQLIDHTLLASSTLGRVVDLGADPAVIEALSRASSPHDSGDLRHTIPDSADVRRVDAGMPEFRRTDAPHRVQVDFAGAFLTPVGGYPSDRAWAPTGSFREITDAETARAAVTAMADAGASCIKVASNATAGPVFDDDLFRTIVDAASARGLSVVAHAEGPGQAQRAARLGAARLAHAPFTERLADDEIARQAASVSWISTLAIHDADSEERATAVDNVRRFHAAGGMVLYGTDMGNGPTPVGLNPAELAALREAGIAGDDLLRALAPLDPLDSAVLLLRLPGIDADPTLARPLTSADLKA
ncbi:hydrolase [Microbacterium sp. 4-7]|uniref:hydrolase n=1 Tax=Microbacterium sp. 4-7 TaxID=1885327 RepID=UPI00164EF18D|nr:hydrolase [Microbacterium sp. 4-7]